jgi:hypothetical protein
MGLLDGYFDCFRGFVRSLRFSKASFQEDCKNFAVEEFKRFHIEHNQNCFHRWQAI